MSGNKDDHNIVIAVDDTGDDLHFEDFAPSTSHLGATDLPPPYPSTTAAGSSASPYQYTTAASNIFPSSSSSTAAAAAAADGGNASIFSVQYYSSYFQLDTEQFIDRFLHAIMPTRVYSSYSKTSSSSHSLSHGNGSGFIGAISGNASADLYGPFWISTTLIIALFVTSSLAQSVASLLNGGQGDNGDKKKDVEMDVMVLSSAAFTIYPYVFGTPMGIWVVSSYLGENRFTLLELWCIYGYSVSVWLPVAVACMIPWGLLRWLFVAVGAVQSSAFILAGVKAIASRAQLPEQQQLKSAITMGIIGIQVVFALALKLYFFSYQTSWPSSGDGK